MIRIWIGLFVFSIAAFAQAGGNDGPVGGCPLATTASIGCVSVDGTTITINAQGKISSTGGSGGGTVTSVSGLSTLFTVANATTTPTFSFATGQTAHEVIGTCGTATTVSLCALVTGDIPTGTSGANIPLLSGANIWSAQQSLGSLGTASGGSNFGSNSLVFAGSFFNVSATADTWTTVLNVGTGTTPSSVLAFTHSGSTGSNPLIQMPALSLLTDNSSTTPTLSIGSGANVSNFMNFSSRAGFGYNSTAAQIQGGSIQFRTNSGTWSGGTFSGQFDGSGNFSVGSSATAASNGFVVSSAGQVTTSQDILSSVASGQVFNGCNSGSGDCWAGYSNNRSIFGYYSANGNAVIHAGSGHGIQFDVNNATLGSGIAGVFDSSGNFGIGTSATVASDPFRVSAAGTATVTLLATATNCASGASPAVCAAAPDGAVAIPTGVNPTLVVNTTAVTANSRVLLTPDDSLTISATTCNSTLATLVGGMAVTARTAGTSFTISYNGTIATNPVCVSYKIEN